MDYSSDLSSHSHDSFPDVSRLKIKVDQDGDNTKAKLTCTIGGSRHTVTHEFNGRVGDAEATGYMMEVAEKLARFTQNFLPAAPLAPGRVDRQPVVPERVEQAVQQRGFQRAEPSRQGPEAADGAAVRERQEILKSHKPAFERAEAAAHLQKQLDHRERVVNEIHTTELKFVENQKEAIDMINNVLIPYHRRDKEAVNFLRSMASQCEGIVESSFLTSLPEGEELTMAALLEHINSDPKFTQYSKHLENLSNNYERLNELIADIPAHKMDVKIFELGMKQHPGAIAITAVQRLPRYKLLLTDYVGREIPLQEAEQLPMRKAMASIEESLQKIQQTKAAYAKRASASIVGRLGKKLGISRWSSSRRNANLIHDLCKNPKVERDTLVVLKTSFEGMPPAKRLDLESRLAFLFHQENLPTAKGNLKAVLDVMKEFRAPL